MKRCLNCGSLKSDGAACWNCGGVAEVVPRARTGPLRTSEAAKEDLGDFVRKLWGMRSEILSGMRE